MNFKFFHFLFALISILILFGCSKKSDVVKKYKLNSDYEIATKFDNIHKEKIITGYIESNGLKEKSYELKFDANDNLQVLREFHNDRVHGREMSWYTNGNIWTYAEFKYGKQDGWYIEYYDNGNKEFELVYKENKKDWKFPETRRYYDGNLWFDEKVYSDTVLRTYYKKDKTKINDIIFKDGKPYEGNLLILQPEQGYKEYYKPTEEFRDGNTIILEEEYTNGKKNGKYKKRSFCGGSNSTMKERLKTFYLKEEGEYKDDLLNGEIKFYNENSKLIKVKEYIEGKIINEKDFTK